MAKKTVGPTAHLPTVLKSEIPEETNKFKVVLESTTSTSDKKGCARKCGSSVRLENKSAISTLGEHSREKKQELQLSIVDIRKNLKKSTQFKCCCTSNCISPLMHVGKSVCQAIDSVDNKGKSCSSPVIHHSLVQASSQTRLSMMCDMHLWKLKSHRSCPLCGTFCAQGRFLRCAGLDNNERTFHLFHKKCVIHSGRNVLSCPHCGSESNVKSICLNLSLTSSPATLMQCGVGKNPTPGAMGFSEPQRPNRKAIVRLKSQFILDTSGLISIGDRRRLEALFVELNSMNKDDIPSFPSNELYSSVVEGHTFKVLHILFQGTSPNTKFSNYRNETALHAAAKVGNVVEAHLLVKAGCLIDANNDHLQTPVILGTEHNRIEVVEYLIHRGADINHRSEFGSACLHIAARKGSFQMCSVLLHSRHTQLDLQDDDGMTALALASKGGYFDVAQLLLEKGANPRVKDENGNAALHWAAFSGNAKICELCYKFRCNINEMNLYKDTAMHIALRGKNIGVVEYLLTVNAECPTDCDIYDPSCSEAIKFHSMMMTLEKQTFGVERIVCSDISLGTEKIPIQCVNWLDGEDLIAEDFTYITVNDIASQIPMDRSIKLLQHCKCSDDCSSSVCMCGNLSWKCWYDEEGQLLPDFNMYEPPVLFECNRACLCDSSTCKNRVVQKGIQCYLQLFRTADKGWGVRTMEDIPKGTFICEYVGEIISDLDADKKDDDSYLFDLDNKESETYCIDARHFGNISRFINHLCNANLVTVKVFVDKQDLNFPRIMFFSCRDISQYEELGFDYGAKFWEIKSKWFTCTCGSNNCKYSKNTIKKTLAAYFGKSALNSPGTIT